MKSKLSEISLEGKNSCKKSSLFLLSDIGSWLSPKMRKTKAGPYPSGLFQPMTPAVSESGARGGLCRGSIIGKFQR